MGGKYLKNSIVPFIIASIVLMPFFPVVQKAEAQSFNPSYSTSGYGYQSSGNNGGGAGLSGYLKGLAPAITQLPLCKKKIKSLKYVFDSDATTDINTEEIDVSKLTEKDLGDTAEDAGNEFDSVKVDSPTINKKLNTILTNTNATKKSTASLDENDTCLKSIGRMVIKMLLQKITMSTVDWINHGFHGSPFFVQNPGKFFKDIAKNEILQFGLEINNPDLFPFGPAFMRAQAAAFNRKFAQNAQYSLNELIARTNPDCGTNENGQRVSCDLAFRADFSAGGWSAWEAMTQVPANNPLGFQLMASNELSKRLADTSQSTAKNIRDQLQQASGFLGDYRCADPVDVTAQENDDALRGVENARTCNRWEYVTPGKMIAERATQTINYPDNQLLKAEDLNDAISAILDALLSQFSNKLMQKGFADFDNQGADGTFYLNEEGSGFSTSTKAEKDYPTYADNPWFSQNANFDIRTDLTQAVIDEQRIFIEKLQEQNRELFSTTPTSFQFNLMGTSILGNYGLIPIINQLDYCIPGPHPDWENEAQIKLEEIKSKIIDLDLAQPDAVKEFFENFGGPIFQIGQMLDIGTGKHNAQKFYANAVQWVTGIAPTKDGNVGSHSQVMEILDTIFDRYGQAVKKVYVPAVMPGITREANAEFNKLAGYRQMIENNIKDVALMKSVVVRLAQIKEGVDELNRQLANASITQEQYEDTLKTIWIPQFGRLSANMVNGDTIAGADSLLKEIKDKQKYDYQTLLKNPITGCEDFVNNASTSPVDLTTRMPYPEPHLYGYDDSGFLKSGNYTRNSSPADIYITDLINIDTDASVSIFENRIGVY